MPAVFFAGVADRLAPPESVRAAFEAWGAKTGADKCFVLLGREHGAHGDYGHGDLAVGQHAREDLFEPIGAFLSDPPGYPAQGERRGSVTDDAPSAPPY